MRLVIVLPPFSPSLVNLWLSAITHVISHKIVYAQVDLNDGEHGAGSIPEVSAKAEASEQGAGLDPEATPEATPEPGAKGDEAAEFWATLQGKQPEQNGTAAVRASCMSKGSLCASYL